MKNNKKKYALVIILILFIAFFSSQCMMTRTNTESKKTVAMKKAFLQMSYLPSSLMKNKIMQLASC